MAKKRQYKYLITERRWEGNVMSSVEIDQILASNEKDATIKARELYPGKLLQVIRVYKWAEKTRADYVGKFDPSQYR